MLFAMKGNRQTKITEDEKEKFIKAGFKIAKLEKNKLVFEEVKTEEAKEFEELKAKYEALKSEIAELKKQEAADEEPEKAKKTKGEGK